MSFFRNIFISIYGIYSYSAGQYMHILYLCIVMIYFLFSVYPPKTKLMEIKFPLIKNTICETAYVNETRAVIDNAILCAGYIEGKNDSCLVFNSFYFHSYCRKCT